MEVKSSKDQGSDSIAAEQRDLIQREQKRLRELQEQYDQKRRDVQEFGEASVNHIKQETKEKIADTETSERARIAQKKQELEREKQILHQSVESQRDAARAHEEQLARSMDSATKRTQERLNYMSRLEEQQRKEAIQGNEKQRELLDKKSREDIAKLEQSIRKERDHIAESGTQDLKLIEDRFKNQKQAEQKSFEGDLKNQRERSQSEINNLKKSSEENLNRVSQENSSRMRDVSVKTNQTIQKTKSEGDKKLKNLNDSFETQFQQENKHSSEQLEGVRNRYSDELKRLHETQNKEFDEKNKLFLEKEKKQKTDFKSRTAAMQRDQEAQVKQMEDAYSARLEHQRTAQASALKQSEDQFKNAYKIQSEQSKEILNHQNLQLEKEMLHRKLEFARDADKYVEKAEDPFYKMRDLQSRLSETDGAYILRANVPEHEYANIQVKVQKNKVSLLGNREFKDQMSEPNRTVESNSYQSFREEFPLEHPVKEKMFIKTYADGVLTVTIPKA